MVGENWSLTGKPCDSCKVTSATVFCRVDSAFLCLSCDSSIHADNKLASRHARVFVCEVCEQAPASVTCKADAAALCATCDRDIHSANPLARRHDRVPVVPFFDSTVAAKCFNVATTGGGDDYEDRCGKEEEAEAEAEVEAGSWLLLGPNYTKEVDSESPEEKTIDYLFNDMESYLDLGLITGEQKPNAVDQFDQQQQFNHNCDGVVPVQAKNDEQNQYHDGVVDGYPTYDMDYAAGSAKHFLYNFSPQCISQSISSSSLDTAVVPDQNATSDVSRNDALPTPISGVDREARVLRYREKRKNRKFEKTIRYASRKAYAETRPRIKGRFAKRTEVEIDSLLASDASSYGVVPTY